MIMEFRQQKPRNIININITSLVDVLFILLIFVLVSTTFLEQPALDIELPKAKSAGLERIQEMIVSISREGQIFFNNQAVNKIQLADLITQRLQKDSQMPVILKADENVSYGLVIEIMDVMRDTGVKKLVALTSYPGEG